MKNLLLVVKIVLVVLSFCCPYLLFSQQGVNDRNINTLNISSPDTSVKFLLPHKLQPASSHDPVNDYDSLKKAQISISKAISSLNEGNIALALFNIHEALNFSPVKDIKTLAIANSYYGVIQVKLGNHLKAVNAMNTSDSLMRKLGDLRMMAFHYNNLGLFYQKFTNDSFAQEHFSKSLEISRSLKDYSNIAITLNLLSKGEGKLGIKKAYIREAIDINKELKDSISLAENFNNLANIHIVAGLYDSAGIYLSKARSIAEKFRTMEILANNYELNSALNAKTGNYKKAYDLINAAASLRHASRGLYNSADIEQMVENRLIARKNYEIQLKDNQLRIKKLNLSLTVVLSVLTITVLLSFYVYYYINSKRKLQCLEVRQKYVEKEKEYAENELLNLATYLNSRNEVFKNIQQGLSKAYKLPYNEIAQEVRKINLYIKSLLTRNDDVEDILERTEKINREFINKLISMHPEITKNERNIALMLRAGLSSKQIATLLDCNPKSVNMARYRMRTHLNLESDKNLVAYLKSL